MKRSHVLPLALAAVLAAATAVRADEIVTRTGSRYEGRIVSEDPTHFVIETADLGTLRVPRADVAKINGKDVVEATPKQTTPAVKSPSPSPSASPSPSPSSSPPPSPSASGGATAPAGAARGAAANGSGTPSTAAPGAQTPVAEDAAAAAKRRDDEAKARAEQEASDAAARLARRKAATLKRRTDPGADRAVAEAPPVKSESELRREQERESVGGAQLAKSARGTQVIVFEPPAAFAAATSGLVLGRRSWTRFDLGGASSASLTMTVADAPRRLTLRLADVQRHVTVKDESSRVRLLEGVDEGDWLRILLDDGTTASGRFGGVEGSSVRLSLPVDEGAPKAVDVPCAHVVQVDGLLRSVGVDRALADLERDEPVGLVYWPDGRELVGRFVDRMEHQLRLDTDADGEADTIVPLDGPIAEVRRIPLQWRPMARTTAVGGRVRLRGGESYGDARVERSFASVVEAVTAYAVAVKTDDGCAIVPFDSVVAWEPATEADVFAAARRFTPESVGLPILPGMPAAAAHALLESLAKGISFVTDGTVVTHVYVAPPYARDVLGLRVGTSADENLSAAEIWFGTDVKPKPVDDGDDRARELISESVDGLRVTAYVDPKGPISAIEITRR
ncbi:MAG: hypothetical protein K8T90_01990 [Planctomycetes bacterium]|nr:hypothetical protein [Planctomycetota bacterium]